MTFTNKISAARGVLAALFLLILFGAVLAIRSCTSDPVTVIPEGAQTLTGVLLPVPISISRRGTHALMQDGHQTALVESTTVNLRTVEGVDVVVTGHFERNTDPYASPVLIASGVTLVTLDMRTWQIPIQKITLDVPVSWNPAFFPEGARFTETGGTVFLAVSTSALTSLPGTAPRISAGGRPAVLVHGTGAETLYVQNGSSIFTLEFADTPLVNDALITRIIHTLRFSTSSSSPATAVGSGSTASAAGIPCGGAAGVLCPAGQYCEITDSVSNIGRCRAVQR